MKVKAKFDVKGHIRRGVEYSVRNSTDMEYEILNDRGLPYSYPKQAFEEGALCIMSCGETSSTPNYWGGKSCTTGPAIASKFEAAGAKLDDGKLPLAIVVQRQFPNALKGVAECSLYGNNKYKETDKDWCNLHRVDNSVERYSNAMMRHFLDAGTNMESMDKETNILHVKHMVWNALALLEILERKQK